MHGRLAEIKPVRGAVLEPSVRLPFPPVCVRPHRNRTRTACVYRARIDFYQGIRSLLPFPCPFSVGSVTSFQAVYLFLHESGLFSLVIGAHHSSKSANQADDTAQHADEFWN